MLSDTGVIAKAKVSAPLVIRGVERHHNASRLRPKPWPTAAALNLQKLRSHRMAARTRTRASRLDSENQSSNVQRRRSIGPFIPLGFETRGQRQSLRAAQHNLALLLRARPLMKHDTSAGAGAADRDACSLSQPERFDRLHSRNLSESYQLVACEFGRVSQFDIFVEIIFKKL